LSSDNPLAKADSIASCSANLSVAERLTTYDSEAIDAEVTRRFEDLDGPCSVERSYPKIQKDCSSVRVYRYRWIRACAEGSDAKHCN
jgi:hypothetical protein